MFEEVGIQGTKEARISGISSSNRTYPLTIKPIELSEITNPSLSSNKTEILRFNTDGKSFYEGIDHCEAIYMLSDLALLKERDPHSIILINLDHHHDVFQFPDSRNIITVGNWVRLANTLKLFNNQDRRARDSGFGMYWVRRKNSQPPNTPSGIYSDFNHSGVNMTIFDYDELKEETIHSAFFHELERAHENNSLIALSIDMDVGQTNTSFPHWNRNIAQTPWVKHLVKLADATMVFRSPEFCPQKYAEYQAQMLRELFVSI